jgi:hypothetical protein
VDQQLTRALALVRKSSTGAQVLNCLHIGYLYLFQLFFSNVHLFAPKLAMANLAAAIAQVGRYCSLHWQNTSFISMLLPVQKLEDLKPRLQLVFLVIILFI